jgi:hypothetical protein
MSDSISISAASLSSSLPAAAVACMTQSAVKPVSR